MTSSTLTTGSSETGLETPRAGLTAAVTNYVARIRGGDVGALPAVLGLLGDKVNSLRIHRRKAADLDKRIPLSIARWHRHVNLCLAKKGDERRYGEREDGKPLFGPAGTIATEKECKAADGRWYGSLFGWMVHANVFSGNDVPTIWGGPAGHEHR